MAHHQEGFVCIEITGKITPFKQWVVTDEGLDLLPKARLGSYFIAAHRLWEGLENDHCWERHMAEKEWCDVREFCFAIDDARHKFRHLKPTITVVPK